MSVNERKNVLYLCGLLLLFINVCKSVKINSITVPSTYELTNDNDVIKLDCNFTVNASDTGFVLKWMHNSVSIYQWIPSKKVPFALASFKDRVDVNYTSSDDRFRKHSALVITKPLKRDSGKYTCNVQTFQGSDVQSAEMQIIDPEDKIDLTYEINQDESVDLKCVVNNIFPLPEVTLLYGEEQRNFPNETEVILKEDLYDVIVEAKLKKNEIEDESQVTCEVKIPKTDYVKRQSVLYDDPKQSATTKKSILGELTNSARSEAGATNEGNAHGLRCSLGLTLFSLMFLLVSTFH